MSWRKKERKSEYFIIFIEKQIFSSFLLHKFEVWNQSWSISGEFQLPDVHSCLRRCEDSRRRSRRESLFCVQFGRFVCNLWLQLAAVTCRRCVSGGCLSAVMRRSGAACNFAALCGNVASDRGMPEDKASSVRPSEGTRVTPAAPCGTPGPRGFPPRAAGVLAAVGKQRRQFKKLWVGV